MKLSDQQLDLLADINEFNIEGRYPGMLLPPLAPTEAADYMAKIAEVLQWLNSQF